MDPKKPKALHGLDQRLHKKKESPKTMQHKQFAGGPGKIGKGKSRVVLSKAECDARSDYNTDLTIFFALPPLLASGNCAMSRP